MANPPADAVEPISDYELAALHSHVTAAESDGFRSIRLEVSQWHAIDARLQAAEARAVRAEAALSQFFEKYVDSAKMARDLLAGNVGGPTATVACRTVIAMFDDVEAALTRERNQHDQR